MGEQLMKEISPSVTPKLASCPLFEGAGGANAAASRGTNIDIVIRELVAGIELSIKLEPEDIYVATWGETKLKELGKGEYIETREEYLGMAVPHMGKMGTADGRCKPLSWVADIKTGQMRNYREQLACYCLACMNDEFKNSYTAHVIYVDQECVRSYDFTYEEAERIVLDVLSKATSKYAEPTPCEYCSWCKHYTTCNKIVKQAESAIALIPAEEGRSLTQIKDLILSSNESMGDFVRNWKLAEKEIAEPVIEEIKARLKSGAEINGWKLTTSAGRKFVETSAIADASRNVSIDTIILAMGGKMSDKKYFELCANNGVEPEFEAIKSGAEIETLRQVKSK
jgi:hypothetical protein